MLARNGEMPWPKLISKYIVVDAITVDPLLSFFSPLEDYIEELQEEELDVTALREEEVRFEKSEDKFRELMNTPTTTTTTTTQKPSTSRTTTSSTSAKPENIDHSPQFADKLAVLSTSTEKAVKRNKYEELLKAYQEKEQKERETQPEKETKKAVYAVGGVLVTTILVTIVAIFGKRRCTRVPKNRRYV